MKKRFWSILLILVMLLGTVPTATVFADERAGRREISLGIGGIDGYDSEKGYNLKISFEINQMAKSFFESKSYDLTQEISTKDMRQLFVECKRLLANHYNQYVYTLNYGGIIYFGKLLEIRF